MSNTNNRNSLTTGITELLVLSILNQNDSYVYEITKRITDNSNNLLSISQNTIYTVVYKLEENNLVHEYSTLVGKKRTRIYYHIEQSGKEYLQKLTKNYQNMVTGVQKILDALERSKKNE